MSPLLPILLSLLHIISASPLLPQLSNNSTPCSKIQSSLTPIPNPPPGSSVRGTVPAALAWDCLQSIPLNATAALALVQSLKPYVAFQSTIGYLKNPPVEYATYAFGKVDLLGGLDSIAAKIRDGQYRGEYEVKQKKPPSPPVIDEVTTLGARLTRPIFLVWIRALHTVPEYARRASLLRARRRLHALLLVPTFSSRLRLRRWLGDSKRIRIQRHPHRFDRLVLPPLSHCHHRRHRRRRVPRGPQPNWQSTGPRCRT
jgi:hypothetical protein